MDKELIESIVDELAESHLHPRGKGGKFVAKGRAEIKFAHGSFLLRDLGKRTDGIKNGNVKRSALSQLKRLQAHTDAMQHGLEQPEMDGDTPDYAQVHRDHRDLVFGVRQFNATFKADLGGEG